MPDIFDKISTEPNKTNNDIFDKIEVPNTVPLDPRKMFEALNPQIMDIYAMPQANQVQAPSLGAMITPETLGGRIMRKAPQIAGGTIGGMIGTATPWAGDEAALAGGGSLLSQYIFAPLIAALGGSIGKAMTLNPNDPEYNKKLLYAALEEGGGELGGRLVAAGLGRMFLRPFRKSVIPEAIEADKALRGAGTVSGRLQALRRKAYILSQSLQDEPGTASRLGKKFGAHLLPGQSTESFADTLQAVAEGSFFYGSRLRAFQSQTQTAALGNLQDRLASTVKRNLIKKVGANKATNILADLSNADAATLKTIENSLYQAIDELSNQSIDIKPLQDLAENFSGKGLRPGAREAMLRQVKRKPAQQTFSELKEIRSDSWQNYEKFIRAGENNNARIARMIALKTDELMETTAKQGSEQLRAAWRTADEFHKGRLRVEWLGDTIAKYSKSEDVAAGKNFVNYIAQMSKSIEGMPSEFAKMGFSDEEIKRIKEFSLAAKYIGTKAAGPGRMLVQLTQAGTIIQIAGMPLTAIGVAQDNRGITAGGLALLIGPSLLAKMMLSPSGSKLLSIGLRAPAGSRSAMTLSVRLLRELTLHEMERTKNGERPQLFLTKMKMPEKPKYVPSMAQLRGFGGRGF